MDKTARIISAIFSPLLIPTYAIVTVFYTTILFVVTPATKLGVIGMTFIITCLIPALLIYLLYKLKVVSDTGLNNRRERLVPYGLAVCSYLAMAFYLNAIHSPMWLTMFMAGAAIATVVAAVVSLYWKISAHATAMGGFLAFVFLLMYFQLNVANIRWLMYLAIVVWGLVCTSRVGLERHTLAQVLAGTLNGVACVFLAVFIGH